MDVVDMNYIVRCFRWVMNELVQDYIDKRLSDEQLQRFDTFYSCIEKTIDWDNLTRENCLDLGFMCCVDEEVERPVNELWLIPHWLLPVIPDGIILTCINNETIEYHYSEADHTVQYGVLTYGILLPIKTDHEEKSDII